MRTGALNLALTLAPANLACQPPPTHRAPRFTPLQASTAQFLLAGPAVGAGSRPGARCGRADAPPVISVPGWAARLTRCFGGPTGPAVADNGDTPRDRGGRRP